jgi:hypothetical protein
MRTACCYGPRALLARQVVTMCLRPLAVSAARWAARQNRSRTVVRRASGAAVTSGTTGKGWGAMAAPLHDTVTVAPRRSDYGAVRLGRRDIDGLILCAEHHGAPYDLLASALGAQPARLRGIVARWRRAGFAATGRLGLGPVLADPVGDGCHRAGLPGLPPGYGSHGPSPRGAGCPAMTPGRPGLEPGVCVVTFRAAHPRRPARARPRRAPARRRGPLAQHRRRPVCRAGVGG